MRLTLGPTWARAEQVPDPMWEEFTRIFEYEDVNSITGYSTVMHGDLFPAGLAARVAWWAQQKGLEVVVDNLIGDPFIPPVQPTISLRAYQEDARQAMLQVQRGILHGVPRSGKTRIMAAVVQSLPTYRPCLWLTGFDRFELARQTADELERLLGESVAVIGDKHRDREDATVLVAMRPSLIRHVHEPWLKEVRIVVGDECHYLASPDYTTILRACTGAVRVYVMSGTPWRNDGRDLILEGNTGPVVHRIPYQTLLDTVNPDTGQPYLCPTLMIFQHMPKVSYEYDSWQDSYQENVIDSAVRNQCIVDFAEFMRQEGRTCLILVDRIAHGEVLADRLNAPFTNGGDSTRRGRDFRQDVLEAFRDRELPIVVSTLYKAAIDIPSLDGMVNAGGMKSSIDFYQGLRNMTAFPGKKLAPTLQFYDHAPFLSGWSAARRRYARNEPSFNVVERHDYDGVGGALGTAAWRWLRPLLANGLTSESDVSETSGTS